MNPTFFHLVFMFAAPLIWFSGNKSARIVVLLFALSASFFSLRLGVLSMAGVGAALCLELKNSFKLQSGFCLRSVLTYSTLITLPLILPELWSLWPGHILANDAWQPEYSGDLYTMFGSETALPKVSIWPPMLILVLIGVLFFAIDSLRDIIKH